MDEENKNRADVSEWLDEVRAFAEYQRDEVAKGDSRGLIMIVAEPGMGKKYGGFMSCLGNTSSCVTALAQTIEHEETAMALVVSALNICMRNMTDPAYIASLAAAIMDGVKCAEIKCMTQSGEKTIKDE